MEGESSCIQKKTDFANFLRAACNCTRNFFETGFIHNIVVVVAFACIVPLRDFRLMDSKR